ncbi:two-component histidine kinase [Streptomyces sp. NBRC 110611]|uniref:serine/threonine-protein kinase n=1 Tax=Streptomyces sp. NBRC 110611 TaxID=1621259 RepID=UPI000857F0A4|nr:serine/threonine-protein kinase [Streptomyces sp. NBRC 110611]GAU69632.1 two-component histidine kinase [Streptomyces sp. NBRC 110611]
MRTTRANGRGVTDAVRMTPQAGDRVAGRYLLQERIGRGGMGVVWRAWDETLKRRVAVKCARPDDERAARRLRSEAQHAGRLHHPNIVGVFDFVDEDTACWIVMEYVPARSLAQIMAERGPLTPDDAGPVGCQVAAALAKSHAEGVVHGDVTPENILVTDEGVARLTDFGISRALWSEAAQTTTGAVRGKPRYLAPEVAQGRPAGEKADVFSLGASLFAAVEGRSPYGEAEHLMAYVARAVEGHIEPAHRAGPLSGPLAALLAVEPRRRPDAAAAHALLTGAAPPSPDVRGRLHDGRTRSLSRTAATLRLIRPVRPVGRRPLGDRRRSLATGAGALVTAAAITAALAVLHPWGPGGSGGDRGGGTGVAGAEPPAGTAAAGRAGTVGEARTADPCALLDAPSLSRFGATERDPAYGEFDRCDVLVRSGRDGEDIADVELNFDGDPARFEGDVPTRRAGNVTVGAFPRDGDTCVRSIATADRKQILLIGERLASPAPDPCALADAATDHAVALLDRGPVPRRTAPPAPASLARLHACTLLNGTARKKVPGAGALRAKPGFGGWYCAWEAPDGEAGVTLQFSRDNTLEDDGEPVVVAGKRSYVAPKDAGDGTCAVRTPHRSYTNAQGDDTVELFILTVRGPRPVNRLCDTAKALAATAARNIAKNLPGK